MGRMLVALFSIALVDHAFGFNPLPVAPVPNAPKVQPRTAPNGVGPVMQTMPAGQSRYVPLTPAGSYGSAFLPATGYVDPALSATQQGQATQEAAGWEPQMPDGD